MGLNGDHFGIDAFTEPFVYIFQVRRLTTPTGTVIDDLYLNFLIF